MSLPEGYKTRILLSLRPKLKAQLDDMFAIWVEDDEPIIADFYVSNSGDDNADGLTVDTAWATLSHVQSRIDDATISAGQSIAFNKGDTFSGSLNLDISLNINSYGSGNNPILTGSETVTGWTSEGGNIYSKNIGTERPSWLSFDGSIVAKNSINNDLSLLPQFDAVTGDYTTGFSLTDSTLSGLDYTNGEVVLNTNEWTLVTTPIASHVGDTITIDGLGQYFTPNTSTHFAIQNALSLMVSNTNWAYISPNLYVYSSDDIANHSLEVATISDAITITGTPEIYIDGVDIKGYNDVAIYQAVGAGNSSLSFQNGTISNVTDGVRCSNAGDFGYFENANLIDCTGDAIHYQTPTDFNAISCNFTRSGYVIGLGSLARFHTYTAIWANSQNLHNIYNCKIDGTGYNGLAGGAVGATTMDVHWTYNDITDANLFLPDGAGMYMPKGRVDNYTEIHHNYVHDCNSHGIYPDNENRYYDMYENTVSNNLGNGIFSNDNEFANMYNNTSYGNFRNLLVQNISRSDPGDIVPNNLSITNNIFVRLSTYGYYNFGLQAGDNLPPSVSWDDNNFGYFDLNYHINYADVTNSRIGGGGLPETQIQFAPYQSYGWEPNSTIQFVANPVLLTNNTLVETTIDFPGETKTDAKGNVYTDSITLQPFTSVVFVD